MPAIAKTTLYLPADLHGRLKTEAARRSRSMTDLVVQGIGLVLARERPAAGDGARRRRTVAAWRRLSAGFGASVRPGVRDPDEIYED